MNVNTKCTWTLIYAISIVYILEQCVFQLLTILVHALTQVCYVGNVSSVAVATCTGYSSTRNGTTIATHCYCVWIWTKLQDGGHVWWDERVLGGKPIAETTLLHLGECAVWSMTCYMIHFG